MILLSTQNVIRHLTCDNNYNWPLNLNRIYEILEVTGSGRKWLADFNAGKSQLVLFDRSNNIDAINVKIGRSVLEEKSTFKILGLTFSSKLDWGFYIVSIAITASKKIGALIRSLKFLSSEAALCLYKSTIRLCMEYFYHVWAGASSYYLEFLDKLQNCIYWTVVSSLSSSLEPLAHH